MHLDKLTATAISYHIEEDVKSTLFATFSVQWTKDKVAHYLFCQSGLDPESDSFFDWYV